MKIPFSQLKTMPRTCRLRGLERKWGGLVGAWKGLGWGLGSIPCDAHSLQLPHYMYIVLEPNAHSLQLPHYMYIVFGPSYIRKASRNAHILRAAKSETRRSCTKSCCVICMRSTPWTLLAATSMCDCHIERSLFVNHALTP